MSILGNVGEINDDLKRTAIAIMRKLNSERIVQTPWVSRQTLQDYQSSSDIFQSSYSNLAT